MTAPNIVDVNAIKGESSVKTTLSTSSSTIVFNQVDSNQVYKINSVVVTNVDGTNAADATVEVSRQAQKFPIVKTVSVPADASLVVMSKETGIYLEEGDAITAYASASGDLDITVSYETIAETANTLVTRGLVLYLDAADLNSYDASENLLTYSTDLSDASWGKYNTGSVTAGQLGYDGTSTAAILTDSDATNFYVIQKFITVPIDTQKYNVSFYVKKTTGGTAPYFGMNAYFYDPVNSLAYDSANLPADQWLVPRINTDTGADLNSARGGNVIDKGDWWLYENVMTHPNVAGYTRLYVELYPAVNAGTTTGSATVWNPQVQKFPKYSYPVKTGATAITSTTANTWTDLSTGGANATLFNSPIFSANTFDFDGSTQYASVTGTALNFELGSIECWCKPDTPLSNANEQIFSRLNTTSGTFNLLKRNTNFFRILMRLPDTTQYSTDSDNVATTDWTHLVGTYDGSTLRLYVNGIEQSSPTSVSGVLDTGGTLEYNIGRNTTAAAYFNGKVQLGRLYNRALSAAEILQNYNAQKSRFGL